MCVCVSSPPDVCGQAIQVVKNLDQFLSTGSYYYNNFHIKPCSDTTKVLSIVIREREEAKISMDEGIAEGKDGTGKKCKNGRRYTI